jgi:uncharacterized membrane protein
MFGHRNGIIDMNSASYEIASEYGLKLLKRFLICLLCWVISSLVLTFIYPEILESLNIPNFIAVGFLLFVPIISVFIYWKKNFICPKCNEKVGSALKRSSIYDTYKYFCANCNIIWDTRVHHGDP